MKAKIIAFVIILLINIGYLVITNMFNYSNQSVQTTFMTVSVLVVGGVWYLLSSDDP